MTGPDRYYLTTAIAYANNRPGLHTLYEVIGADAIARWHRMVGRETRFLTGTDEHSVNIAQQAADEGRSPLDFVDEKVALFKAAEAELLIAPDRFIRTTDPDHVRAAQEMVRRAYANGDIYLGTYEGWYCPSEGFRSASEVVETARGTICPNHPDVPLQWLSERNWFFRLSAYQERLERHYAEHPDFVQPDYRRNEMLGFIRQGLEDFSISRAGAGWGIPFPIAENGETAQREDGTWDPEAGRIYVWYDALINYITGAGFPDDPASLRPLVAGRPPRHRQGHRPVPHHLLAGDAVERRARGAAAGLGPRLPARPGRADEQEPGQLPGPRRGRRRLRGGRRPVRRPARGAVRPGCRRQLGLVRPALQRRPGQRLRQPRQPDRVDGRSLPGQRSPVARPGRRFGARRRLVRDAGRVPRAARGLSPPRSARGPVGVRGDGQQDRRRRAAVGPGEGGQGRRRRGRDEAARRPRRPRRGLPVGRAGGRPVHARDRPAGPGPARLPYPYGADGNGGPPLLAELAWGAHAAEPGTLASPVPLFPRLESEPAESEPD